MRVQVEEGEDEVDEKVLPGFLFYVRNMYKKPWFPKVDEEGVVFLSRSVGRAAKNSKEELKGSVLQNHMV